MLSDGNVWCHECGLYTRTRQSKQFGIIGCFLLVEPGGNQRSRDLFIASFSVRDADDIMDSIKAQDPWFDPWSLSKCHDLLRLAWDSYGGLVPPVDSPLRGNDDGDTYDERGLYSNEASGNGCVAYDIALQHGRQ